MSRATDLIRNAVRILAERRTIPKALVDMPLEPHTLIDDLGIDSLGLASLLSELEEQSGVDFPDDVLSTFLRVKDITDYLESEMGSK